MGKLLRRREFSLFILILLLMLAVSLRAPNFPQPGNLYDIANDTAILIMVAIGQMMVIITGGIDLSVSTDAVTKENLQLVLEQDLGIDGRVVFQPYGDGLPNQERSVASPDHAPRHRENGRGSCSMAEMMTTSSARKPDPR